MAGEPASAGAPARACRADRHTSWDRLDGTAGSGLAVSRSAAHPPRDPLAHGPQSDFWEAPGDSSVFFGSPPIEQSPAPGEDILALVDQLSSPSQQLQGLLSADDDLNAMLYMGRDACTALDMDIDPLLDPWDGVLPPSPLPQCFGAASSLMRFREEMDQRVAAVDAYFSDPLKVLQGCKEEGADGADGAGAENPAALLLTCSKEFIDIVQSLTPAARPALFKDSYPHNQLASPNSAPAMHMQTEYALSTEIVLLVLPSYLALMKLYDSVFHCVYKCLCYLPPDSFKSVKVKSVLRIGGISSLQDMPLQTYATGILDAVQGQVRALERCMGIPAEYCLSGEAAASHTAAAPGIFSRADRVRLFRAVMAQEDVKSRRGTKSYVESIRASIQDSVAFLDG
ncbi:hypothetical protein B0T25DRAFT_454132 [Lasiosphaeria hispida]|uniref:Uncharacterized protein n=1 Tax=Lasiosphaeria hispida TaxID=260671 RepID=A0AAJ0HJV5_9PEZI|nr:hypothetical protein B0T25DRAFT_454132 [Lasiosphaeria hispida]